RGFLAEAEPNSTTATASAITLTPGSTGHAVGQVSGNITTSSDTDFFSLGNLHASDVVDLSVAKPGNSTLDPRIDLIQGTTGGFPAPPPATTPLNSPLTAGALYSAKVSANPAATAGNQALYVLNADITDTLPPSLTYNTLPVAYSAGSVLSFDGVNDYVQA